MGQPPGGEPPRHPFGHRCGYGKCPLEPAPPKGASLTRLPLAQQSARQSWRESLASLIDVGLQVGLVFEIDLDIDVTIVNIEITMVGIGDIAILQLHISRHSRRRFTKRIDDTAWVCCLEGLPVIGAGFIVAA